MKIKVASMFAGIGGIDLGFNKAGFEIVWANEIDKYACKTYTENFGNSYLVEDDIRNINTQNIPDIDVLTAGFPCQPFSIAGKQQGFNDERGQLFYQIERVVKDKKPRVVFLENVSNLGNHNNGKSFEKIFISLTQLGYTIRYAFMNVYEYTIIPQNRDRIYIVAFRDYDDSCKFKFPDKSNTTKTLNQFFDINVKHSDCYYYNENSSLFNALNKKVVEFYRIYKIKDNGIFPFTKELCPTLTANMGTFPNRVPIIRDVFGIRKLTPYELLSFQGFPNNYKFPKGISLNQAYKQIGNSVCVPIIKIIAKEIRKIFEN